MLLCLVDFCQLLVVLLVLFLLFFLVELVELLADRHLLLLRLFQESPLALLSLLPFDVLFKSLRGLSFEFVDFLDVTPQLLELVIMMSQPEFLHKSTNVPQVQPPGAQH